MEAVYSDFQMGVSSLRRGGCLLGRMNHLRLLHNKSHSQPLGPLIRSPAEWSTKPASFRVPIFSFLGEAELAEMGCVIIRTQ